MGFFDALLGGGKKLKGAAPDRLFAMTTAYVAMQTELDMTTTGKAGIVFQPLATSDFEQLLRDAEELLSGTAEETGTSISSSDDAHGYRWIVLGDQDFEDLVVAMNTLSTELQAGGYGDRLLAAVFPFDQKSRRAYFIYNYKRGAFYPFVPSGGAQQRDNEAELRLKAQLADEGIPFEAEMTRWFPLWDLPI
jgi:hypothetical protein